jgi:hypothetical protein
MSIEVFPFVDQGLPLNVARGLVPGVSVVRVFGSNNNVGNSLEDIWGGGGIYPFPDTTETFTVTSSSVNDIATTGSGARTLTLDYLDGNFDMQTETVNMNGTGTVATVGAGRRLVSAKVATCGTYGGSNTGTITVTHTTSTDTLAVVAAVTGESLNGIYTIPNGMTGFVTRRRFLVDGTKQAEVILRARENADDTSAPVSPFVYMTHDIGVVGSLSIQKDFPVRYPAKTDLVTSAIGPAAGSAVTSVIEIILVED